MDLVQIAEIKNKIAEEMRQIEALRQSMKDTRTRIDEWEKDLRRSITSPMKKIAAEERAAVPSKPQRVIKPPRPTTAERTSTALRTVGGEFTRGQLLAEAERDGEGTIGPTAFCRLFSELIKTGRVRCVAGRPNGPDSHYVRSDEAQPDQASSVA